MSAFRLVISSSPPTSHFNSQRPMCNYLLRRCSSRHSSAHLRVTSTGKSAKGANNFWMNASLLKSISSGSRRRNCLISSLARNLRRLSLTVLSLRRDIAVSPLTAGYLTLRFHSITPQFGAVMFCD